VDDSWSANSEEIAAAKPDLVIAAVPYQEKSVSAILKAGARFLGLAPKTLSDIYGDIVVIAGIVAMSDHGDKVVTAMQQEIERVRERARDLPRRTVFCEEWGKPLIASQPWVAELVEAAGGAFVETPGAHVSFDAIRVANPDVLIAAWCGAGDRVPLEKIVHERGWQELSAVQERRVYCIPDEYLNTPAPTLIQGLHALAGAIHPERFPQPTRLRRLGASRETRSTPSRVV
jgi:iron complex transport system substrate-binding protein